MKYIVGKKVSQWVSDVWIAASILIAIADLFALSACGIFGAVAQLQQKRITAIRNRGDFFTGGLLINAFSCSLL
jgi:hypothetical protein